MGIFSAASSWRTPLQLIDCWLPAPSERPTRPSRTAVAAQAPCLQTFHRAGWLMPSTPPARTKAAPKPAVSGAAAARCRNPAAATRMPRANLQGDGRLWIAGRIDEVCAELERLEALQATPPATEGAPRPTRSR